MIARKSYGVYIHFSNELREKPRELMAQIKEAVSEIKRARTKNILVKLDEPDPKSPSMNLMDIGDLLGEKLLDGSKVAVCSNAYVENISNVLAEVIIYGRGTPIKYFNSEDKAMNWFESH